MAIYLLKKASAKNQVSQGVNAAVVRSDSKNNARKIAAENLDNEFSDSRKSSCELVDEQGEHRVILTDEYWG